MSNARKLAERIAALPNGCLVSEIEQILEPHVLSEDQVEGMVQLESLEPEFRIEGMHAGSIEVLVKFRGDNAAAIRLAERKILECLASKVGLNISIDQALAFCHFLRDRAAQFSEKDFHKVMNATLGCDAGYSRNARINFQNNPAAFLASRNPQTQSVELLKFIFSMPEL